MNEQSPLADTLRAFMERERRSVPDLATLTGISERTIEKWLRGESKRPRWVDNLLLVAAKLPLNRTDADRLLTSAGYPPLASLRAQARQTNDQKRLALLDPWDDRAVTALAPPPDPLPAALALLAQMPTGDDEPIPLPASTLPPGSRMPFSRNALFVGREDDLKHLAGALKGGNIAAIGQITAATGLGGIGKTQLAAEFVHRYGQYFAGGVFWLSFADANVIPSEVAACGGSSHLDLRPNFGDLKLDEQVQLVQAAWRSPLPRLLIFDNCEDEDLLARWRPTTGGCRVLLTSRRAHWDATLGIAALPLDVLRRQESIALLRKHRPDMPADDPDLDAIAAELGDLPLALHLAGSFLARYHHAVIPAAYLAQLRRPALLKHPSLQGTGRSPTHHIAHVGRTFQVSYARLDAADATNALATQLLARAASFAPGEPIPRQLLLATLELGERDDAAALRAEDALARLIELGLLDEMAAAGALRLHRLLAAFVRETASDATAQAAVEQALLTTVKPLNAAQDPAPMLPLQRHLYAVTDLAQERNDERAAGLCHELSEYLYMIGNYTGVRYYTERALAIREQVLGPTHPDTATSLDNMGVLLRVEGDLAGSRPYHERALAIREQVLGPTHPDTAISLNNLGVLLWMQGDLAGARPYHERALAIREQVLGPTHPNTAISLNNLGVLLQNMGDLTGAWPYLERALAIREQVLGSTHPDTALTLNNLGYHLYRAGDLAGARPYYERALAIREQVLGPTHPDTATSLNNLGVLLYTQGDLAGARPYWERALAILEQVLGSDHPHTQKVQARLAALDAPAHHPQ
jgi:tetratricopeptide (TPR) repeat protein/transcriptional regulator with XRE-family HTH domain